jgi:predicted KAP-like P-loop ATPase
MPLRDDNPSEVDLLGFEDVIDVLESIVTRTDLDPVTVGVNAPWGGGKTTVLQLLKRRLEARDDIFCLLVSPWEYDNKTDPTTALIDEVLGGLEAKLEASKTFGDKMKAALKTLRRRVNFLHRNVLPLVTHMGLARRGEPSACCDYPRLIWSRRLLRTRRSNGASRTLVSQRRSRSSLSRR